MKKAKDWRVERVVCHHCEVSYTVEGGLKLGESMRAEMARARK